MCVRVCVWVLGWSEENTRTQVLIQGMKVCLRSGWERKGVEGEGGSLRVEREGEARMLKQQRTTTALWEPAQKSKHSIKRQEASRSAQKAEPSLFRAQRKRV